MSCTVSHVPLMLLPHCVFAEAVGTKTSPTQPPPPVVSSHPPQAGEYRCCAAPLAALHPQRQTKQRPREGARQGRCSPRGLAPASGLEGAGLTARCFQAVSWGMSSPSPRVTATLNSVAMRACCRRRCPCCCCCCHWRCGAMRGPPCAPCQWQVMHTAPQGPRAVDCRLLLEPKSAIWATEGKRSLLPAAPTDRSQQGYWLYGLPGSAACRSID